MKKILMGTSALALAGTIAGAGKAEAAEWSLDWGGYFNSAVIYRTSDSLSDSNPNQEGIDVVQDAEIDFHPSIVLDNGLKFGVNIELEAESGATTNIDESSVYVTGPFGRLELGADDGPANTMHTGAPNVGWFGAADGGDVAGYLGLGTPNFGRSPAWGSDATKITYYTPRFAGFQVGASYAHDENSSKNAPSGGSHEDLFELGANYVNSFGAFDISVGGVYATADGNAAGLEGSDMYGGGISLGFSGFVIGGNYTVQDVQGEADDRDYYDLGVAYSTGPWGASIQWAHSEQGTREADHYLGAVSYDLGPGVTAGVYAGFGDGDGVDSNGVAGNVDGFLVGTGFALSF